MTSQIIVAVIAGLVAGIGSAALNVFLGPVFQHRLWRRQRADDLRLAAINEFNKVTNTYLAVCVSQTPGSLAPADFLRDLNMAAWTIRVLFSDEAHEAVKKVEPLITSFASWNAPDRLRRGHEFSEVCYRAMDIMYREVIALGKRPPARPNWN